MGDFIGYQYALNYKVICDEMFYVIHVVKDHGSAVGDLWNDLTQSTAWGVACRGTP